MLDRPTLPTETPIPFAGSALILLAASKEEAIATLKADPYTAGNVWDWEKAEIYPVGAPQLTGPAIKLTSSACIVQNSNSWTGAKFIKKYIIPKFLYIHPGEWGYVWDMHGICIL